MCRFIRSGSARWMDWSTRTSKRRCPAISSSRLTKKAPSSRRANCCFRSIRGRSRRRWIRRKASWRRRKGSWRRRARNWRRPRRRLRWRKRISAARNWMWIATLRWRSSRPSRSRIWTTPRRTTWRRRRRCSRRTAQVETAKAQIMAAEAAVQSAKAAVETAQINLGFTRLTSPIDGIPGIAQQQVGALVSPASGDNHHRVDARSDQGLLHGQRAGVSRLSPALPDAEQRWTRSGSSCGWS